MNELLELIQTESVGTVEETLDFFLYECSLDEAPTIEEVKLWRDELDKRRDGVRAARLPQAKPAGRNAAQPRPPIRRFG